MSWYHRFFKYKTIHGHGDAGKYRTYLELFERLRLHIFWRGDGDPHPHDHPMAFWTFPLTPYVEEITVPRNMPFEETFGPTYRKYFHVVSAFRWHYRPATYLHRLLGRYSGKCRRNYSQDEVPISSAWVVNESDGLLTPTINAKPVVTIVWLGKRTRDWGYLVDGQWRKFDA